jgi:hypothetical protein
MDEPCLDIHAAPEGAGMATGGVKCHVTDTLGKSAASDVTIDFEPAGQAAGGATSEVTFHVTTETVLEVSAIQALGGLGTRYKTTVTTDRFKTYAFFQVVVAGTTSPGTDSEIRLVVKPKRVQDITAPAFSSLHSSLRTFLDNALMQVGQKKFEDEDGELVGKSGEALYDALGPLRKACLLNLFTKARDASAAKCWSLFRRPLVVRQDRFFCEVAPTTKDVLQGAPEFVSAGTLLHKPLPGYTLVDSFKSRDPHANLQVTVMHDATTGTFAADVDIDESNGFEHGFEVIRNRVNGRTNPYLIRELLLLSAQEAGALDPGYRFVFKT